MLHPRAVLPVRVNGICVPVQTSATVYTFFVTYLICIFVGWILLMGCGVGLTESMSTVISAIGNVGPGLVLSDLLSLGQPFRRCQVDSFCTDAHRTFGDFRYPAAVLIGDIGKKSN